MNTLNLLSEEKKTEFALRRMYVQIKDLIQLFLVVTILVAIALLTSKLILVNAFNKVTAETSLISKTFKPFEDEVNAFNQLVNGVDAIQREFIPWSQVVSHLSSITPKNIEIQGLVINQEAMSIVINGSAKSRNDFLALQRSLEQSKTFTNIESPIANILKKDNINFQLTAVIELK